MTGAELDTRRRSLGLSVQETADVLAASLRTLSYWIAGNGEPRDPGGIADRLVEIETAMGDLVDDIAEHVADNEGTRSVVLPRYRDQAALDASGHGRGLPLGAHAMAMAWAMDELRADGVAVSVKWAG